MQGWLPRAEKLLCASQHRQTQQYLGNRLYQNCTHGLCWYLILPFSYYIWESTQHLNTALLQNYHCKWPSPKEHRAWFHTGFKATGQQCQYRLARQGLCQCSCIPNQCMLTASGRASWQLLTLGEDLPLPFNPHPRAHFHSGVRITGLFLFQMIEVQHDQGWVSWPSGKAPVTVGFLWALQYLPTPYHNPRGQSLCKEMFLVRRVDTYGLCAAGGLLSLGISWDRGVLPSVSPLVTREVLSPMARRTVGRTWTRQGQLRLCLWMGKGGSAGTLSSCEINPSSCEPPI